MPILIHGTPSQIDPHCCCSENEKIFIVMFIVEKFQSTADVLNKLKQFRPMRICSEISALMFRGPYSELRCNPVQSNFQIRVVKPEILVLYAIA